ncbi:MAG: helix-turn-helix domain-containing protein [Proteobacteria bacterium]|nr:helix-turn-helix domain-containing protein [Pseudomonadota bacterium]
MAMQNSNRVIMDEEVQVSPFPVVENILERKLEDIVTLLRSTGTEKSRLYEEVLSIVERNLIKIALKRSNNVKTAAADFLGINRNTLHKKMGRLGINCEKE